VRARVPLVGHQADEMTQAEGRFEDATVPKPHSQSPIVKLALASVS